MLSILGGLGAIVEVAAGHTTSPRRCTARIGTTHCGEASPDRPEAALVCLFVCLVQRIRDEVPSVGFDERPRSVLLELRHKHTNFLHAGQNYSFFAEQVAPCCLCLCARARAPASACVCLFV